MQRKVLRQHLLVAFAVFKKKIPNPKTRGTGYYKNKYGNWCKCSTGNMMNAARLVVGNKRTNNRVKMYVDERQAPYLPYTNEKWISPRWKGKKNPNRKWYNKAMYSFCNALLQSFGGGRLIKRGGD